MIPTKLLSQQSKLPSRANKFDAGADLYLTKDVKLVQGLVTMVDMEISIALPENTVGLIFNRSSNAKRYITLANAVGVIDSGYRGSIKIPLIYNPPVELPYHTHLEAGDRVAQLVILPVMLEEFVEVESLATADGRGVGGFGSTGV